MTSTIVYVLLIIFADGSSYRHTYDSIWDCFDAREVYESQHLDQYLHAKRISCIPVERDDI